MTSDAQRQATLHNQQGLALASQGQTAAAEACFRQAIALWAGFAQGHHNLAVALDEQGRTAEAVVHLRQAVRLEPSYFAAVFGLGGLLERLGQTDEGLLCYRRAAALRPDDFEAHHSLGCLLAATSRKEEALVSLQRAQQLRPDSLVAMGNLADALEAVGRLDEAEKWLQMALRLNPKFVPALVNLAVLLKQQDRFDDALVAVERALALEPNCVEAIVNRGMVLERLGRIDEAIVAMRRAVELEPAAAQSRLNLGLLLLLAGNLEQGWPEYEWRVKCSDARPAIVDRPRWAGESLAGRTILLQSDQGLGDTLQFVRYAALLKQRGARVVVESRPQLASLLRSCPGVDAIAVPDAPVGNFDVWLPVLSLPGAFHTTIDTVPAAVPYLFPRDSLVDKWRGELAGDGRLKVGIAWQGNPRNKLDRYRSIPLTAFAPLIALDRLRLYSLQEGLGREQLAGATFAGKITDLGDRLGDFENTAAIMRNLDLIVTCDSAPAHLAGALGVPTWLLLPRVPDWRWMLERSDSPWYPSMRLFRQPRGGHWASVLATVAEALRESS